MTEAQEYTTNLNWPLVRKASFLGDIRDWFAEYKASINSIDTTVYGLVVEQGKTDVDGTTIIGDGQFSGGTPLTAATSTKNDLIANLTKEPTGFQNPQDIDLTYNPTTRKISVSSPLGSVDFYYKGVKVTEMVGGWESTSHATGFTVPIFLYYNGSSFIWSTSTWDFDEGMVAYVSFDPSGTFLFALRECHGFMQHQLHKELHETIGTYRTAGGSVSDIVIGSNTAAERRPIVSACTINDEDLPSVLALHNSKSDYTILSLTGASGVPSFSTGEADMVELVGAQPYFNEFSGGTWGQSAVPNNNYFAMWLVAFPTTEDSGSQDVRFSWLQGQTTSLSLTTIQNLNVQDLDLGTLGTLSLEYVIIEKSIFQYSASDWEWVETQRIEGTREITTVAPSSSYVTSVAVDGSTVTGDGTSGNPLVSDPDAGGAVMETDFNAQTVLAAVSDDTPSPVTVGEGQTIKRFVGGNLAAAYLNLKGYRAVTSSTDTALVTDELIGINYAGLMAETLPSAAAVAGKLIFIADVSGAASYNTITVETQASEKINGDDTFLINVDYGCVGFFSDGTNFFALNINLPGYDSFENAIRFFDINATKQPVSGELFDEASLSVATHDYYIDVRGMADISLFYSAVVDASSEITITIQGTVRDDGTAPADCEYGDITDQFDDSSGTFDAASLNNGTFTDVAIQKRVGLVSCLSYIKIQIEVEVAATDAISMTWAEV